MLFKSTGQIVYKTAKKIVVAVIGTTLFIFGMIMLVTPGPGVAVIIAALAMLSLEFAWARRWLKIVKERSKEAANKASKSMLWLRIKQSCQQFYQTVKSLFQKN